MIRGEITIILKDNTEHRFVVDHNMDGKDGSTLNDALICYIARNSGFNISGFISYVKEKGYKMKYIKTITSSRVDYNFKISKKQKQKLLSMYSPDEVLR